ncbi:glycogen debranching protein GlgX [Paracoccus albicereus]|uniref:glycogen debranching protein GlgX n=1 Tax=Paracoccus albicereus TaxID=2922394 RepID=UPI003F762D95
MPADLTIRAGRPWPMGATVTDEGVNIAVFSANATAIDLCLFDATGAETRLRLPARDGDVWHGFVPGLQAGARYGLRADGPYAPHEGHRFNVNKLLIDPYARSLDGEIVWDDALYGFTMDDPEGDLSFDTRDSAPFVPKCVVCAALPALEAVPPLTPARDSVIYEAHVRGLTMRHPEIPQDQRGTYAGVASDPVRAHLRRIGVTAVELLPVHAFLDDRFLVNRGLRNYWGYQTIGFFTPAARYGSGDPVAEFRAMVDALHRDGIEVILDVVYNHSGEGDEKGPTLSFRGLDNASYYHLSGTGRHYVNHTGTGNALNLTHPAVLRLVMDSLRYWTEVMGVDGFRFDLASELTRGRDGFATGFLDAIRQDPVLARVKLIAEPWDIGPGGYRLGQFPVPFMEWNDRFRDDVRRFWRGDAGTPAALAKRLLGSAEVFDHDGRSASSSVNFVACHDGFTLNDAVSYAGKHNEANGEQNRDGHHANFSDNLGSEGPTEDAGINAARAQRKRNMLATVFLSQGVPMLLAGDEMGHSQGGNNNAYAQDNETTWLDWPGDQGLTDFVARLTALRRAQPVLRQRGFLHSRIRPQDGLPDLEWHRADGRHPTEADWHDPNFRALCAVIRGSAESDEDTGAAEVYVCLNSGEATAVTLPDGPWLRALDTAAPDDEPAPEAEPQADIAARSVTLFTRP